MTGYPKNDYQEEKNEPYRIIAPKGSKSDKAQPLINYQWSSYEPFALPNVEKVDSFLYLTINPITCEYFQQITFRAIDYILIQVILLLNQP